MPSLGHEVDSRLAHSMSMSYELADMTPTCHKNRHLGVSCWYPRRHVFAPCRRHVGRRHVGPDISCLTFWTSGRHADIRHIPSKTVTITVTITITVTVAVTIAAAVAVALAVAVAIAVAITITVAIAVAIAVAVARARTPFSVCW
jgi:hypothetical protein